MLEIIHGLPITFSLLIKPIVSVGCHAVLGSGGIAQAKQTKFPSLQKLALVGDVINQIAPYVNK